MLYCLPMQRHFGLMQYPHCISGIKGWHPKGWKMSIHIFLWSNFPCNLYITYCLIISRSFKDTSREYVPLSTILKKICFIPPSDPKKMRKRPDNWSTKRLTKTTWTGLMCYFNEIRQKQSICYKFLFWFSCYKKVGENHVWPVLSNFFVLYLDSKGHLISECLFGVLNFPKKPRKMWSISAPDVVKS